MSPKPLPDHPRAADVRRSFLEYFAEQDRKLRETIEPGFFERKERELTVTPAGRLFVRNICMVFDRYLDGPAGEKPVYSKTV